jgi:hypothetical protein
MLMGEEEKEMPSLGDGGADGGGRTRVRLGPVEAHAFVFLHPVRAIAAEAAVVAAEDPAFLQASLHGRDLLRFPTLYQRAQVVPTAVLRGKLAADYSVLRDPQEEDRSTWRNSRKNIMFTYKFLSTTRNRASHSALR